MDKTAKLDQLIDGAEELLTRLADAHNPDIQMLRDRVDAAINDARRAIERDSDPAYVQLRDLATTVDSAVRDHPWLALGGGVLLAATVAFLAGTVVGAGRSSKRDGP